MSEPFLGEIKMISFNFPPKGWAFCNGQTMSIQQNMALFSLLGTNYGGNGSTNFNLPNLQGRVPTHVGGSMTLGQPGGEEGHTLTTSEMAGHTHTLSGSNGLDQSTDPGNAYLAASRALPYRQDTPNTSLAPKSTDSIGGNQPHANMQPYLTIAFVVALVGAFPSRN